MLVTTGSKVPAPTDTTRSQFSGVISPLGRIMTLTTNTPTRCSNGMDPTVAGIYTVQLTLPATISVGSVWQDTTAVVTCRGDVPITTTTINSYRATLATDIQGRQALEIHRQGVISISSTNDSTRKRSMQVTGNGTGTATLHVDANTGTLLDVSGESHTTFTIVTPRSTLPFRQDATEHVILRP
jgi:hypothetical protein